MASGGGGGGGGAAEQGEAGATGAPMEVDGGAATAAPAAAPPAAKKDEDDEDDEEEVQLSRDGMRLWLRPGSAYHKSLSGKGGRGGGGGGGNGSSSAEPPPPPPPPAAPTGPKRSARVADRNLKERQAAAAALDFLIELPLPGLPDGGALEPGTLPVGLPGVRVRGEKPLSIQQGSRAANPANASGVVGGAASGVSAVLTLGDEPGAVLPIGAGPAAASAVSGGGVGGGLGGVGNGTGGGARGGFSFSVPDGEDPFALPLDGFAAPMSREEAREQARKDAEEEKRRQAQRAAELSEEIGYRVEELKTAITRAERLEAPRDVLARAHEHLTMLGGAIKRAKTAAHELSGAAARGAPTSYRGVTRKSVTLGGQTHPIYEAFYESRYLGCYESAAEGSAAYAEHLLVTHGLAPPADDPFARPDVAAAAAAALPPRPPPRRPSPSKRSRASPRSRWRCAAGPPPPPLAAPPVGPAGLRAKRAAPARRHRSKAAAPRVAAVGAARRKRRRLRRRARSARSRGASGPSNTPPPRMGRSRSSATRRPTRGCGSARRPPGGRCNRRAATGTTATLRPTARASPARRTRWT